MTASSRRRSCARFAITRHPSRTERRSARISSPRRARNCPRGRRPSSSAPSATRSRLLTLMPTRANRRRISRFCPSVSVTDTSDRSPRRRSRVRFRTRTVAQRRALRAAVARSHVGEVHAFLELRERLARQRALDRDPVFLRDARARVREAVRELAVVREQHEAGRVRVEAADRVHAIARAARPRAPCPRHWRARPGRARSRSRPSAC